MRSEDNHRHHSWLRDLDTFTSFLCLSSISNGDYKPCGFFFYLTRMLWGSNDIMQGKKCHENYQVLQKPQVSLSWVLHGWRRILTLLHVKLIRELPYVGTSTSVGACGEKSVWSTTTTQDSWAKGIKSGNWVAYFISITQVGFWGKEAKTQRLGNELL